MTCPADATHGDPDPATTGPTRPAVGEPSELSQGSSCSSAAGNLASEHDCEDCKLCVTGRQHLKRAKTARDAYRETVDKLEPDELAFTADMQKVLLLPKMTTKNHFFVSRLVIFNETFACMNGNRPDFCIMWHEELAGRGAAEVASSYLKCVELSGASKLLFWADNCCGQNKNWILFTVLTSCVNSEWGPDRIRIRYLEKGHTFMKADSIHGQIGRKVKRMGEIITFDELCDTIDKSGQNIKVVKMSPADFKKCASGVRSRRTSASGGSSLPKLQNICEVTFNKGSRVMQYREGDCGSESKEVDFLLPKFQLLDLKANPRAKPRGLQPEKKAGILQLLASAGVTPVKRRFWYSLEVNKSVSDLVDTE